MRKILALFFLVFFASNADAQLQNYLQALKSDSADALYGTPVSTTPFWTIFTSLATSTDSLMSSLQKYGQSIDNYSSVANAKAAAKKRSGLLIVPRKSRLYQDSTVSVSASDSIVVFDFRNGKLVIDGNTSIIATVALQDTGTFNITYDSNNNGTGDFLVLENTDTTFIVQNGGKVGIGDGTPTKKLNIYSSTSGGAVMLIEDANADASPTEIQLNKNSSSPADEDKIGKISFLANDSAGTNLNIADIIVRQKDMTTGSVAAGYDFRAYVDGAISSLLTIDGYNGTQGQGDFIINDGGKDIDFRIESDTSSNALYLQGSSGYVGINTSSPSFPLHIFSGQASSPIMVIESDHTLTFGGALRFFLDSTTPSVLGQIGYIQYEANNSVSSVKRYAQLDVNTVNVTSGSEGGEFAFRAMVGGALSEVTAVGNDGIIFNEASNDLDTRIESNNDANAFFLEGSSGNIGLGSNRPIAIFSLEKSSVSDTILYIFNDTDTTPDSGMIMLANGQTVFGRDTPQAGSDITFYESTSNAGPVVTIENESSSGTGEARLELMQTNSGSGITGNDNIGEIYFIAENSLGSQVVWSSIEVGTDDRTNGTEKGDFNIDVQGLSAPTSSIFHFDGTTSNVVINDDSRDFDLRVESDNETNAFFVLGSDGNIGMGTNAPSEDLHLQETINGFGPEVLIENISSFTGNPVLRLSHNNSGSGIADLSTIGEVEFVGEDGRGNETEYGYLRFIVDDTTESSEDSDMQLYGLLAGSPASLIHYDGLTTTLALNDDSKDIDTRIESDNDANALVVRGSNGNTGFGTNTPQEKIDVNSSVTQFDSLKIHREVSVIADDDSISLASGTAGWGQVMVGDNEEWSQFRFTSAGTVTLLNNTANVVNTGADTKFSIWDVGTAVSLKNRLGSKKKVAVVVNYFTP